jgi:adhesin/invasin
VLAADSAPATGPRAVLCLATILAGAFAGCTSDGSTNPTPTPSGIAVASGNNQSGTVGAALAQPLVILVEDATGSPMAGVTVAWTVISGGGTLATATTTTENSGQAQTAYTLGPTPGTNQVKAAVEGSTLETTITATGEAPPADNTPAALVLISGDNQSATVGTPLPDSLVVEVRNAEGTPLANMVIEWTVTAGGGTLGAATRTTNAAGRAANAYTVGSSDGTNTVTAAVQGNAALFATSTATATSNTPASVEIVSGNSQSATVNTALAQPLVVRVENATGQGVAGVTVAWSVAAGGGTLGSATTTTNAQGQASNTYTVGGSAGTNTVEAAVQSNTSLNLEFTATATAAGGTAAVAVQDFSFNPFDAPVNAGGTVTWTWTGSANHNVTWVSGGFANSSTQSTGTHQVTFPSAGTFSYYCTLHGTPTTGMRGTVTVQ